MDGHGTSHRDGEEDVEDVLASLEAEDDTAYRSQRLQQLKYEAQKGPSRQTTRQESAFMTLSNDDETLRFTTEHERAVVHFFHPDFARCTTMDQHCQQIAAGHLEYGNADVAFGRVDVQKTPFLVEKLNIRVLPCVIGFVQGIARGRVTGFEGVCWDGNESSKAVTLALEEKFMDWTVLSKKLLADVHDMDDEDSIEPQKNAGGRRGIRGRTKPINDEDDDWN